MRSIRGTSRGWSALRRKKHIPKKRMKCYESRKHALNSIGYETYAEYLTGELWKGIRDAKLTRYPYCVLCSNGACQVHHLSYDHDTLTGGKHFRLVQLCRDCHLKIEFDGKKKRPLHKANKTLFHLATLTEKGRRWIEWVEHRTRAWEAAKQKKRL